MASIQDNNDSTCVVCFKNVDHYSIGECDHPVCYECSTRMRVLCLQNECPICRQDLSKVIFTSSLQPYKILKNVEFVFNQYGKKYKIHFSSDEVYKAYLKLLEHKCKICESGVIFKTFELLHEHTKREHELFYCDLCITNLKIFTFERKCYTRQKLALHRRKGDPDDTSHRGHPMCEFCQMRYMDNDDLFRHLRKQHLYCDFCDVDGLQQYYDTHTRLFEHYKQEHFVCEEGECRDQSLTAVFRTDIDLKAHKASIHGRGLPRAAARQARTLELHFALTPRPPPHHGHGHGQSHHVQAQSASSSASAVHTQPQRVASYVEVPEIPYEEENSLSTTIDTRSINEFPSLSNKASVTPVVPLTNIVPTSLKNRKNRQGYNENFPALDTNAGGSAVRFNITHQPAKSGPSPAVIRTSSKPNVSIQVQGHQPTANNFRLTQPSTSKSGSTSRATIGRLEEDFPSLASNDNHPSVGASAPQKPKIAVVSQQDFLPNHNANANHGKKALPPKSDEAFPALSKLSSTPTPATWITVKNKDKGKKSKVTPPPDLSPPPQQSFNSIADFPMLKGKNKTKKKAEKKNNNNDIKTINENIEHLDMKEVKQNENKKQQNSKKKKKGKENSPSINGATAVLEQKSTEKDSQIQEVTKGPSELQETVKQNLSNEKLNGNKSSQSSNFGINSHSSFNNITKVQNCNGSVANIKDDNICSETKSKHPVPPPGFAKPPPGFVANSSPGYVSTSACNGLTFTNSSGQSFFAPQHQFVPPPDFERRNVDLITKCLVALGDPSEIPKFKKVSQSFRESLISGETFYEHCREKMGDKFGSLFPELVALLPDIQKQQELQAAQWTKGGEALPACAVCGQVLVKEDSLAHSSSHWPSLSESSAASVPLGRKC